VPRVAAVDLGATSARVAVVDLDTRPLTPEVVHRVGHQPQTGADGELRWDWQRLVSAVEDGLERAMSTGPLHSIGIDTWAVDYGLVDRTGGLIADPVSYRSDRTAGWEAIADRLGRTRLFDETGLALMGFNTLFQLAVHDRQELAAADRLLLLPELLAHHLTGAALAEQTSAGSTQLVDVRSGRWHARLLSEIDVPLGLLPEIRSAGTRAGSWRGVPVHLVGGHDTASAVAACPADLDDDAAFISSGSWLLVGRELPDPVLTDAARHANLSNERAVDGGYRLLKNVVGLGMLEQCRPWWDDIGIAEIVAEAAVATTAGALVDATDHRFLAPVDMPAEVRRAAGLPAHTSRGVIARVMLDSIAAATANVVAELAAVTARPVPALCLLGGGTRLPLLVELVAEATGLPVRVGPAEATALGNALVQGVALGEFEDLASARGALVVE
jgi:rhamnulokinase